jgi:hypothetical protein
MMRSHLPLILFALAVLCLIGCNQPKVSGKVVFLDGSPLTTGTVTFENDQHMYRGQIKSDGTFSMGMLKDGEGIPPGEYRVAVEAIDPETDIDDRDPQLFVHRRYASASTSGITYNIQKNTRDIVIEVEKP